jgi:hypothetical protein
MEAKYDGVVALTDAFCRDRLNDEYRDLARAMAAALCRKRPSPLASGQPRSCLRGDNQDGLSVNQGGLSPGSAGGRA